VRSWTNTKDAKPLGFIAYKAGMTHIMAVDNRAKSATKGEKIALPVTIFDCPPMFVYAVSLYKKGARGAKKVGQVFASEIPKDTKKSLSKLLSLPNAASGSLEGVEFDYLRLLVVSNPSKTSTGAKKAKVTELAIGGSKDDQLSYAKENLGKEIKTSDVFADGALVDVHAVTKGKGFQGTTKRYGTPLKHHKSEKGQRGIGNLGAWTPKRVDYRVAQPGKMGYHQRTEYNKQILKSGENPEEVNSKSGLHKYGAVKNTYVLIKGGVAGPRKAPVLLTAAIRPRPKAANVFKGALEVTYISQ